MLSINKLNFIYEKEKNLNFFIKIYKSIKLLNMIRIKKLPILYLIYFMNMQASNIINRGKKANIKDVLIKIREKNRTERKGYEIIDNLGYSARLRDNKKIRFKINSLKYNGIRIDNTHNKTHHSFSKLKLNDKGKLEGKNKNGNDIPENKIMISYILFYANITIGNNTINTFIHIIPQQYIIYNNVVNTTFEMEIYDLRVCLDVDSNGVYSNKDYDYIAGSTYKKSSLNYNSFILANKPSSIKISNFEKTGYIYYFNSRSEKLERITLKPEATFNESEGERTLQPEATFNESEGERTLQPEATFNENEGEGITKSETSSDGKRKEVASKNNIKIGNTMIILISIQIIFWLFIQIY
ncbi:hypothetical protein SLOPH_507 [Spraguea lophii 42_110]|uniref:Uncharacterized protein n=1 Tax=Spraguea lophii (strain 42_110) TaxID=1358809 RepID=S7W940_SPRLO|nr:hypothetical protein SLOPH_507 [Spraguea lophii 42_110]